MKKIFLFWAVIIAFTLRISATEISCTPGNLATLINNDKNITSLTVTGVLDVRDFKFIYDELSNLTSINLQSATIAPYSGNEAYFGQAVNYDANTLPPLSFFGKEYVAIVLPGTITKIGDGALSGCTKIQEIQLPTSLTTIGEYAFSGCSALSTITIPESVTTIGQYAFSKCVALTTVEQPTSSSSVTIGNCAFLNCPVLSTLAIAPKTSLIGASAFMGCKLLTTLTFPSELHGIGESAFRSTSLTAIDLTPCKTLATIGMWAFADNKKMVSIKLPDTVTSIGDGAFYYNTELQSISLPKGITSISDFMLAGCISIDSPDILNENLTEIGKYAFSNWNSLRTFIIPKNVESIGDYAFENCISLTEVTAKPSTPPTIGTETFSGVKTSEATLYVPDGSVNIYKATPVWNNFNIFNDPTGSKLELSDNDLKAYFSGNLLIIKSNEIISEYRIYDMQGIVIASGNPNSEDAVTNAEGFRSNFYIVGIKHSDNNIHYIKIARK